MKRERLWAPWRVAYVKGEKPAGCVFCRVRDGAADRENLVLCRGEAAFVVLNRYPYTAGHLMVVPNRHLASPEELAAGEWTELGALLVSAKKALDQAFRPDGYNVGINVGKVAGAGVADHLHLHVVPRWSGDTNFMPVVGEVQVISQDLLDAYDALRPLVHGPDRAARQPHGRE